jgi:hypothetical protein
MAQVIQRRAIMSGTNHELAEDGSYFVAKNPTFGTGLATAAAPTALDDLHPFLLAKGPTTPGKRQRWDYLRIVCTAPGTAGTAIRALVRIDPVTKADPTGGTQLTLVSPNTDTPSVFESKVFAGPLVAAAASGSVRELVAPLLKNAIPAIGDVYLLKFGCADQGVSTSAGLVYYGGPPIILGVGQIAAVQLILPSQSAASSYEVELGGWEK